VTVQLPDLRNWRDVGGLATGDGRHVRSGVVYRSASPMFLDAEQVTHLVEGLGVRTRVDLRSDVEIAEVTNEHLADAAIHVAHLPFRAGGTWQEHPASVEVGTRVATHYMRYLEHSPGSVTGVARLLADAETGPVLMHCSAGKDRTGVALAVVLSAVGVLHEEIVRDYARTQEDLEALLDQLRGLPRYAERLAALPEEGLTAEPASMEIFLSRLEQEHGGARSYLTHHGVGPEILADLEASLLTR
jgi:protein tyrosine/serine phosphatase